MRGLTSAPDLEQSAPEEVLAFAAERFNPRVALACSFQKEEAVLLEMLAAIEPRLRVFTIDTGVLFPETYATWRAVEERYGIEIEVHDARPADGTSWSAENCCSNGNSAKVDALGRALAGLDAWVTGLRREQSPTRAAAPKLEREEGRGIWKVNPLVDWTERQVWAYIVERDLPYNPLHDRGYESIGCAPCTVPGQGREGRWAGQDKTECGLHEQE